MDLMYKVINNKYSNIKQVLREEFHVSSRLYIKLKNSNQIYLNSKSETYDKDIHINDVIEVNLNFNEDNSNIVPNKMNLNILYEDDYMLIINIEAGFAIHPSIKHYDNSLSNGVKNYFDSKNINRKIRIVNRLDKDTSGIVIFAKNEYIQECLIYQMQNKMFKKEYLGILDGILTNKKGTINAPIARRKRQYY